MSRGGYRRRSRPLVDYEVEALIAGQTSWHDVGILERYEAVRQLTERAWSTYGIAYRLNVTPRTVCRARRVLRTGSYFVPVPMPPVMPPPHKVRPAERALVKQRANRSSRARQDQAPAA